MLVEPRIFLRHWLIPNNIACGETDNHIQVVWTLCDIIDIVTEGMRSCKEHFRQLLGLQQMSLGIYVGKWCHTLFGDERSSQ